MGSAGASRVARGKARAISGVKNREKLLLPAAQPPTDEAPAGTRQARNASAFRVGIGYSPRYTRRGAKEKAAKEYPWRR
mgnify:CR=1 FL=1